jgi:hypothetical protein
VNELYDRCQFNGRVTDPATHLGTEQQQARADSLAAAFLQVFSDLRNRANGGLALSGELLLNLL